MTPAERRLTNASNSTSIEVQLEEEERRLNEDEERLLREHERLDDLEFRLEYAESGMSTAMKTMWKQKTHFRFTPSS